jgi:hypothetical protein
MSLPQLVDQAAAVATVLAELDLHRSEPVLITLAEGPGFAESFAGAVDQDALPLRPTHCCQHLSSLSAPELAAPTTASQARLVLTSPDQRPRGPHWTRAGHTDQWTTRTVDSRAAAAVSTMQFVTAVTPWLRMQSYAMGGSPCHAIHTKIASAKPRLELGNPQMMPWCPP